MFRSHSSILRLLTHCRTLTLLSHVLRESITASKVGMRCAPRNDDSLAKPPESGGIAGNPQGGDP